jgi:hypothetical protein
MKTRNATVILALLLAASCKTKDENSYLPIVAVVPPTATVSGVAPSQSISCAFDPAAKEITEMFFNPAQNVGTMAAVVENNLTNTTSLNPVLRTDSTTFLPHQAVVDYEMIGPGAPAAPGEQVIPVASVAVPSGGRGTVGVDFFSGTAITAPNGTRIRVTFHVEGKLLDGSTVHTAAREYLFNVCNTAGCADAAPWAVFVNAAPPSPGTLESCY